MYADSQPYQIVLINVKLWTQVLDGKYFEVYFTRYVVIGFGNLTEETGEAVAARIYGKNA